MSVLISLEENAAAESKLASVAHTLERKQSH